MPEKKVLIVDYDKKSIENLGRLFSSHDLEVVTATDGESAFQKYQVENPDLILLEPMLPKLHGFDLVKKIRKESGSKIAIVIITALYKSPQYRNEALNTLGVAEYLDKPCNEEQLLNTVLSLVHGETGEIEEDLPDSDSVIKTLTKMAPRFKKGGKDA
jgi:DNA-binding response OmpR family regulator